MGIRARGGRSKKGATKARPTGATSLARDVLEPRLCGQQLMRPMFGTPEEVVRWMGAMQAQDYAGAKWAVGLRVAGREVHEADVERAIAAGTILRTHVMRWTWQLVLPEDVRWMLALVAPRLIARAAGRDRELELDAAIFRKSNAVLEKALRDGHHRTRDELAALLERARISTADQRLSHLLGRAELDGILASGARRGKQFTYVHLDHRAPLERARFTREEGLAELARRYFHSRGPAQLEDFIWWSGLTVADARAGLEAVRAALHREDIGGRAYFRGDASPPEPKGRTGPRAPTPGRESCHLLPAFDEYLVAYRHRDALIEPRHARHVNAGGGMLNPSVILDGRLIGTWRRELVRGGVAVNVNLFEPASSEAKEAIARALERFGRFLGADVRTARLSVRRKGTSSLR